MTERVAVVTTSYPSFPGDPAGHFVETEVRRLAAAGAHVTVIAPRVSPQNQRRGPLFEGAGPFPFPAEIRVLRVDGGDAFGWPGALTKLREQPSRCVSALSFIARSRAALRSSGPFHRVIAHWIVPCGVPIALGHPALEAVVHGSDARLLLRLPRPLRAALAFVLIQEKVHLRCVSDELRRELVAGLSPRLMAQSSVRPSPIDMASAPTRTDARRRLALDGSQSVVVIAGRLVESKRVDVALDRAMAHSPDRVVVLGEGPLKARLMDRYPWATFLGHVSRHEALTWIAGADLLVSGSTSEGAPTVVREARALGVPVLAAAAGDLPAWAAADPGLTLF